MQDRASKLGLKKSRIAAVSSSMTPILFQETPEERHVCVNALEISFYWNAKVSPRLDLADIGGRGLAAETSSTQSPTIWGALRANCLAAVLPNVGWVLASRDFIERWSIRPAQILTQSILVHVHISLPHSRRALHWVCCAANAVLVGPRVVRVSFIHSLGVGKIGRYAIRVER